MPIIPLDTASLKDRADRDVVRRAVQQTGDALQHAAEALKGDRDIVLEAVKQSSRALAHAAEELKRDRDFVLAAVKLRGMALEHASQTLQEDRRVVLTAVKQDGVALQHASDDLRRDREIVRTAMRQNRDALQHCACDEVKSDLTARALRRRERKLERLASGTNFMKFCLFWAVLVVSYLIGLVGLGGWQRVSSGARPYDASQGLMVRVASCDVDVVAGDVATIRMEALDMVMHASFTHDDQGAVRSAVLTNTGKHGAPGVCVEPMGRCRSTCLITITVPPAAAGPLVVLQQEKDTHSHPRLDAYGVSLSKIVLGSAHSPAPTLSASLTNCTVTTLSAHLHAGTLATTDSAIGSAAVSVVGPGSIRMVDVTATDASPGQPLRMSYHQPAARLCAGAQGGTTFDGPANASACQADATAASDPACATAVLLRPVVGGGPAYELGNLSSSEGELIVTASSTGTGAPSVLSAPAARSPGITLRAYDHERLAGLGDQLLFSFLTIDVYIHGVARRWFYSAYSTQFTLTPPMLRFLTADTLTPPLLREEVVVFRDCSAGAGGAAAPLSEAEVISVHDQLLSALGGVGFLVHHGGEASALLQDEQFMLEYLFGNPLFLGVDTDPLTGIKSCERFVDPYAAQLQSALTLSFLVGATFSVIVMWLLCFLTGRIQTERWEQLVARKRTTWQHHNLENKDIERCMSRLRREEGPTWNPFDSPHIIITQLCIVPIKDHVLDSLMLFISEAIEIQDEVRSHHHTTTPARTHARTRARSHAMPTARRFSSLVEWQVDIPEFFAWTGVLQRALLGIRRQPAAETPRDTRRPASGLRWVRCEKPPPAGTQRQEPKLQSMIVTKEAVANRDLDERQPQAKSSSGSVFSALSAVILGRNTSIWHKVGGDGAAMHISADAVEGMAEGVVEGTADDEAPSVANLVTDFEPCEQAAQESGLATGSLASVPIRAPRPHHPMLAIEFTSSEWAQFGPKLDGPLFTDHFVEVTLSDGQRAFYKPVAFELDMHHFRDAYQNWCSERGLAVVTSSLDELFVELQDRCSSVRRTDWHGPDWMFARTGLDGGSQRKRTSVWHVRFTPEYEDCHDDAIEGVPEDTHMMRRLGRRRTVFLVDLLDIALHVVLILGPILATIFYAVLTADVHAKYLASPDSAPQFTFVNLLNSFLPNGEAYPEVAVLFLRWIVYENIAFFLLGALRLVLAYLQPSTAAEMLQKEDSDTSGTTCSIGWEVKDDQKLLQVVTKHGIGRRRLLTTLPDKAPYARILWRVAMIYPWGRRVLVGIFGVMFAMHLAITFMIIGVVGVWCVLRAIPHPPSPYHLPHHLPHWLLPPPRLTIGLPFRLTPPPPQVHPRRRHLPDTVPLIRRRGGHRLALGDRCLTNDAPSRSPAAGRGAQSLPQALPAATRPVDGQGARDG